MQPYAVVVDHHSGKASIIDLTSYTDAGEISLTSTTNALADAAFASFGTYAYVTDPSEHKIFSLTYTGISAPWYSLTSTYTNSAVNPTGVATDLSNPSSVTLYVTDAQSGSGHLYSFVEGSSLSTRTTVESWGSFTPESVAVNPGESIAYVSLLSSNKIGVVNIPGKSFLTSMTPNSSFTANAAIGLSADGSTFLAADSASASVQENGSQSPYTATNLVSTDADVAAIAPAPPVAGAWYAYATGTSFGVDVVNTATDSIVQQLNLPGATVDAASPDGQYVYVDVGNTIDVIQTSLISTSSNPVVGQITQLKGTEPNAVNINQMAVSPNGDTLLATDAANGAVYVIDTNSHDTGSFDSVVARIGILGSGNGSTVSSPTGGLTYSPDGLNAYITEVDTSNSSYDGVTVLNLASSTTAGYVYGTTDETLSQGGDTLITPQGIAADPNGEYVYVTGDASGSSNWLLYKFPVTTNSISGQINVGNGSGTPVTTGTNAYGVVYSPEDDSAFVSNVGSQNLTSVSQTNGTAGGWTTAIDGLGGNIAVSPDGQYVATTLRTSTCGGIDGIQFMNAGTGVAEGGVTLNASNPPSDVAFAPQTSPQSISTTELAGGASNPAEAAVTSGMNDVVSSGTPSDAPGASAGVDTATGAYSMSVDSMTIPDIGPSLDQTATYDSSRASTNSLLGYGWDYSYGMTASQNGTTCVITVTFGDGATTTFNPTTSTGSCSSRNYQAEGWAQDSLTQQSSCNGSDSCWVIKLDAQTSYSIDETNGELVKIADLNGNAVTISWGSGSACPGATSGEPCEVLAADSIRFLKFSYPTAGTSTCPSGSYTCVVVTDPLGRTLTYVKNSTGDLVQISLANSSETATYALTYGSGHLLSSWWDPNNEANDAGNTAFATDVSYTSGKVTQVTGPEIYSVAPLSTTPITPTTTIAYEDFDNNTGDGTVLIQNPDFKQSNYEPGASQTLDTYSEFQLVSSVTGYGLLSAYDNGSSAPLIAVNPSESAYPMRDDLNLMPNESMNALAGSTESAIGCVNVLNQNHCAQTWSQVPQYDSGVVFTTYDAFGNALSTVDELGNTTANTYNGLNEVLTSTDAMSNQTVNTYNSTGQLLTTTSPAPNGQSSNPKTSNWYSSNGTICASRDADQVANYGVLSSCVSAGSNATTYSYDSSGDTSSTTVTDSSTQTSTTQNEYDSSGNVCATLSPDGYAISGDRLTGCPSSGAPYATVTLSRDVFGNPLKTESSLSISGTNTYATTYSCTDSNGNTTASVGPLGSAPTCPDTSYTTSVDTTFTAYDPYGDKVQSISPFSASGSQGPTSTSQFDANASDTLDLSANGYAQWAANHSTPLAPLETGTLIDDQGNQVASAPQNDLTPTCESDIQGTAPGAVPSSLCPDTSFSAYDNQGQQTNQAASGNQDGGGTTLNTSGSINNSDGSVGGNTSNVGGGSGTVETADQAYNKSAAATNTVNEHWSPGCGSSGCWVTDSSTSTAYANDGSQCWTAPTTVSNPLCSAPPTGVATVDYFDANGNIIAEVGPGGAGTIEPGGACNPLTAVATAYTINTSDLCAFTTYNVYNEAGKLTETIEPSASSSTSIGVVAGITTTYTYDASGNQATVHNPAGNTITSTYDGANRLIGITYSDVGTTNCSAGGSTQDTCYSYNADGTRSQMVDSTGTTSYTFDNAGHLISVTDSNGNTVTYGYNQFGQESCISYPGFATADSCLAADNPNNGTNTIDPGEVWYSYDQQGRMSTITDWNGDAFTYGYDCTGDVAWLLETPTSQAPSSITECAGSSGTPTAPTPPSGTTYVLTSYNYSSGGSGNLLASQTTDAVTHSGSTSLLEFNSLTYDANNNLTSSTPKVSGTTETADAYGYDSQQRVTSGPETSGSKTAYSYANSNTSSYPTCSQPYCSHSTVDQMGIDAMPDPGASAQVGAEFAGNGELCWIGVVTTTKSGSCASPGSTSSNYETVSYNTSGDMTSTAPISTYGSNTALTWNVDTNQPTCINPSGTSCTSPSSSQPQAATYSYNADGLRTTAKTWNSATSSVVTTDFTWNTLSSALVSNGTFDYLYGLNPNVPIGQVDTGDSVSGELLNDPSSNVRGIVEVTSGAANPFVLDNYTDYDVYGNPITKNGGSVNSGGLTIEGESSDPDSATSFGFGGGFEDPTGLVYLVHRYYSSALGQFTSVDPLLSTTRVPFAYTGDNPLKSSDPTGLWQQLTDKVDQTLVYGYTENPPVIEDVKGKVHFVVRIVLDNYLMHYSIHWDVTEGPPIQLTVNWTFKEEGTVLLPIKQWPWQFAETALRGERDGKYTITTEYLPVLKEYLLAWNFLVQNSEGVFPPSIYTQYASDVIECNEGYHPSTCQFDSD